MKKAKLSMHFEYMIKDSGENKDNYYCLIKKEIILLKK